MIFSTQPNPKHVGRAIPSRDLEWDGELWGQRQKCDLAPCTASLEPDPVLLFIDVAEVENSRGWGRREREGGRESSCFVWFVVGWWWLLERNVARYHPGNHQIRRTLHFELCCRTNIAYWMSLPMNFSRYSAEYKVNYLLSASGREIQWRNAMAFA